MRGNDDNEMIEKESNNEMMIILKINNVMANERNDNDNINGRNGVMKWEMKRKNIIIIISNNIINNNNTILMAMK